MLEIGRARTEVFQPVAPPVRVKEFPPFSRSPPGPGCDFGFWAGIGADFGDGPLRSIAGTNARIGPQ